MSPPARRACLPALRTLVRLVPLLALALRPGAAQPCSGNATFAVSFNFDWSQDTDDAFPNDNPLLDPGFSRIVCASHNLNYSIWAFDTILSDPLRALLEDDDVQPLLDDIKHPRNADAVLTCASSNATVGARDDVPALRVDADPARALLSCVAKINPSADWFVGVSADELCVNGTYLPYLEKRIFGWDGGFDDAQEYDDSDPIQDGETPLKIQRLRIVGTNGYGVLTVSRADAGQPFPPTAQSQSASPNAAKTDGPAPVVPNDAICVDAAALAHLPPHALLYPAHRPARVLCDPAGSCATPGHIVVYRRRPMMMQTYCRLVAACRRRVKLVNSPRYAKAIRINAPTDHLQFTAFAARFATRTEEHILSFAVRVGL